VTGISLLLVGIGGYGENYIDTALNNPPAGVDLVGVVDPFIDKSQWKQRILQDGIDIFPTLEEFYSGGGKADLVVISSPIHTHYDYIVTALEHHGNVLCEQPVCLVQEMLDDLIRRERKSGCFVAVGYQLCFTSGVQELKADIAGGLFGAPQRMKALRMMRRGDRYYSRNGWAGKMKCRDQEIFDSPLSNACAHQLQTMLYILGLERETCCDVISVEGQILKGRPTIENFDAAALQFRTDRGADLYFYTAHCIDETKIGPMGVYEFELGRVVNQGSTFRAEFTNGMTKDYPPAGEISDHLMKLTLAADSIREEVRPAVSLISTLAHTKAVNLTQRLPVPASESSEKAMENGDRYWSIPGLAEAYLELYDAWKLPQGSQ